MASRPGLGADTDNNADTHADVDTNNNTDTHDDADTLADTDADTDTYADTDPSTGTDADTHPDTDSDTGAHKDSIINDADTQPDPGTGAGIVWEFAGLGQSNPKYYQNHTARNTGYWPMASRPRLGADTDAKC